MYYVYRKFISGKILQKSCDRAQIPARILQDLAGHKFSVHTVHSENLCISPKGKHNQPLEVKFDELYTCSRYFVNEHV